MASPPDLATGRRGARSETPDQHAFRSMLLMRRFEEKVGQLYALGRIPALPRLSIGREGLTLGLLRASSPEQIIVAGRRCHALMLGCGLSPDVLMSALMTDANAIYSLLEQTSLTIADRLVVPEGGAEGQLECAQGLACDARRDAKLLDNQLPIFVVLDGAEIERDTFANAIQAAAQKQLNIIVLYDMALLSPSAESLALALEALCCDATVEFKAVDGIDYRNVEEACRSATETVLTGAGPVVLEVATQAFRGHGGNRRGQPNIVDRSFLDPVLMVRSRLIEQQVSDEMDLEQVEGWVRATINSATEDQGSVALIRSGRS